MSGLAAFLMSCSDESATPDITGATTEPSTSPTANLTEEQKALLARSFYTLVDSSKVDSLKAIFGTEITAINYKFFNTHPWSVKNDQVFSYPSKDGRKICDVVTYKQENRVDQKGVLRATFYSDYAYEKKCKYANSPMEEKMCPPDDYLSIYGGATIVDSKVIEVEGIPVVMKTVGSAGTSEFYGYGVSCGEYLNEFKHSCSESNGLFLDLGDACYDNRLSLACASFIPEGETPDEVLNSYTEAYKIQCLKDSIKYAPYDDENNVLRDPYSDSLYRDSVYRVRDLEQKWYRSQRRRSMAAYRWQFSVIDSSVQVYDDSFSYQETGDEELSYAFPFAYNTLPDTKIADAYRKEGVYVLPDSLVAEFFPQLATFPTGLEGIKDGLPYVFYIIVLKDVGAKGHWLTKSTANGIYVTDIVKSGNCPEDSTVHYSMILLVNSPDWDVFDHPIVKTTFVSDNWNCDKPETLEKKEPYGEWIASDQWFDYEKWLAQFETDKYLAMFGGKDRFIELFGEDHYLERTGED